MTVRFEEYKAVLEIPNHGDAERLKAGMVLLIDLAETALKSKKIPAYFKAGGINNAEELRLLISTLKGFKRL